MSKDYFRPKILAAGNFAASNQTYCNMKKTAITILVISILTTAATAKIIRRQLTILPSSVPETETIAQETMEFVYDYKWCVDTAERLEQSFDGDQMLLQISPGGLSKFSSFKNLTVDSLLMKNTREQIANLALEDKLSTGEFMTIYKNYPEGKLTHTEKICYDWLRYDEDMPQPDWQLTDSVIEILGYECHGAICNFRGRHWMAFYCEDIPVMDGPWKLSGLPGLIMKATDSDGHYTFECIGIKSKADRPITIYKVPYNKTTRTKFYDTKHRWDVNPYAYYEASTGGHVTVSDESGNPMLDAYDPIELPYDYIERDWKK